MGSPLYLSLLTCAAAGFGQWRVPMTIRSTFFSALLLATTALITVVGPAHALTMQECSAKYKAAQTAGTAKGIKWNDFRRAECGADATAAPAAAAKPEAKTAPVP